MKLSINSKLTALLAVSALAMTGCQDEDFGYEAKEIAYKKEFIKAFGQIDPQQDFSLVRRASITVTPGANQEIKIYSKSSGTWKLVGQYSDVTSTKELGIDLLKGTEDLMVTDGFQAIFTKAGENVVFGGKTRAGSYDGTTGIVETHLNEGPRWPYYYFDKVEAVEYETVLPENGPGHQGGNGADVIEKSNLLNSQITKNFKYVSTGEFIVYPMFWATSRTDVVGVYYEVGSDMASDTHVETKTDNSGTTRYLYKVPILSNQGGNQSLQYKDGNGFWTNATSSGGGAGTVKTYSSANYWRSKGVIVNIPAGTEFGFYLNNGETNFYSDGSLNGLLTYTGYTEEAAAFCSSYYDRNGDLVLGMEDWPDASNSHSDFDLNDLIFKFGGYTPIVIDNSTEAWILAYEDLGESYDWDFNDVIVKFEYISGKNTAKVTPMAAGGTLHSIVCFKENETAEEQRLGEIHVLMGATEKANDNDLYTPINADSRGNEGAPLTVTISDPTNFSVTNWGNAMTSTSTTTAENACGVYLNVVSSSVTKNKTTYVAYKGAGNVPELLILPEKYEIGDKSYVWAWPKENVYIYEAYKGTQKFNTWVADHEQHAEWYKYPTGDVVEAKYTQTASDDNTQRAEYTIENYGTKLDIPTPTGNNYSWNMFALSTSLLPNNGVAVLTIAAKGAIAIAANSNDINTSYGTITDIDGNPYSNASVASLGVANEGIWQITLSQDDIAALKANDYMYLRNNKLPDNNNNYGEILAMAIKTYDECPVTLSQSSVVINMTETTQSTVAINRNGSAGEIGTPSSSAESVATAEINGTMVRITAKSSGNAVITIPVKADDTFAGKTFTINVTVSNLTAPSLTINDSEITMLTNFGGSTTATYSTVSTGSVQASSNTSDVTVSVDQVNKIITVTAAKYNVSGTATITVAQSEVTDEYASDVKTFTVNYEIGAQAASGTTTYEGDALNNIKNEGTITIPGNALVASSSIKVTLTLNKGNSHYYCHDGSWGTIFGNGYPFDGNVSEDGTERSANVDGSYLSKVKETGILIVNQGEDIITKIVVEAE